MKICKRAVEFVQIINEDGAVRQCSWLYDGGVIGNLTKNSMEEIYHSPAAKLIHDMHAARDHSNCNPNQCPYAANDSFDEMDIEIDEIPKVPYSLYLAYENTCNYRCIMCDIPNCMARADVKKREEKLNKIDEELRKILPYVKQISANGLGELFVSKHILKLLSEWKPIADPSEVSVVLETNGSLFDEEHWKQIENLGQYNLSVDITVLSFENEIYQKLSGTKQPVEKLIENLHFVKSLREKGIVNYFEIATVFQEGNFRQLPEFARRCVEEFGADYVRLRPFDPWAGEGLKEWMMDVRNAWNPYHQEFLEVMKDPIFKHPKVHDWSGGQESGLGPEPYKRLRANYRMIEFMMDPVLLPAKLSEAGAGKRLVIYGMTLIGKTLINRLRGEYEIPYCLDRKMEGMEYAGVPLHGTANFDALDKDVTVIIALNWSEEVIERMLRGAGYEKILYIRKLTGVEME